jgi:hypothetical protein
MEADLRARVAIWRKGKGSHGGRECGNNGYLLGIKEAEATLKISGASRVGRGRITRSVASPRRTRSFLDSHRAVARDPANG